MKPKEMQVMCINNIKNSYLIAFAFS